MGTGVVAVTAVSMSSHGCRLRDVDRVAAALYTPVLLPTANFVYAGLWQTASMLFPSGSATKAA